jgi:hypothetical protein
MVRVVESIAVTLEIWMRGNEWPGEGHVWVLKLITCNSGKRRIHFQRRYIYRPSGVRRNWGHLKSQMYLLKGPGPRYARLPIIFWSGNNNIEWTATVTHARSSKASQKQHV